MKLSELQFERFDGYWKISASNGNSLYINISRAESMTPEEFCLLLSVRLPLLFDDTFANMQEI